MNFEDIEKRDVRTAYHGGYPLSLQGQLRFELTSRWGRLLLARNPPVVDPSVQLLNLGCGGNRLPGWVNADFYVLRFWRAPRQLWMIDLRYRLRCPDNYWDGVFCEHTLEHLFPHDVHKILCELLRTLKPKAWLRIVVPDLAQYVDFYSDKAVSSRFSQWPTGAEAIHSLTQQHGHQSVWDAGLLKRAFGQAGYKQVRQVAFMEGSDNRLFQDTADRKWESLYMEAQKA